MLRRSNYRDYYDVYSILQNHINFKKRDDLSLTYSEHILSTKNLLAMLTDSSRFLIDKNFELLNPKYNVSPIEIEYFLRECIKTNYQS
jgi:hypothetical protein